MNSKVKEFEVNYLIIMALIILVRELRYLFFKVIFNEITINKCILYQQGLIIF